MTYRKVWIFCTTNCKSSLAWLTKKIEDICSCFMKWWTKAQACLHLQFLDKEQEETDEDLDFRALENGYVSTYNIFFFPSLLKLFIFFLSLCVIQSYRNGMNESKFSVVSFLWGQLFPPVGFSSMTVSPNNCNNCKWGPVLKSGFHLLGDW